MSGWYDLSKSSNGQFRFVLKAGNAESILSSEQYTSRASAADGIASVQKNAPLADRCEKRVSTSNKPYFTLKAGNHRVIGTSDLYDSEAARDNGIATEQENSPTTAVKDHTGG